MVFVNQPDGGVSQLVSALCQICEITALNQVNCPADQTARSLLLTCDAPESDTHKYRGKR